MANNKAISIENLTKIYKSGPKQVVALDNISFSIPKGSIFGLLGPNGAGKSTLINIIAGLVNKSSGRIQILDYDFDKQNNKAKHKLGIVPQELVLDPFFTVKETLDIYAGYYGVKNPDSDKLINALGLSDKRNAKPRGLSGGMKRRLLVAKALVHSPDILILDEPTAGVDIELRKQLWDYVVELNKAGKTIILTTHYLEEAEELCDEIAIIDKGKIIALDKTKNLKDIFGEKQIIIETKAINQNLAAKLSKEEIEITDGRFLNITSSKKEIKIHDIINLLNQEKISIIDIKSQESDLEDIFRKLITK